MRIIVSHNHPGGTLRLSWQDGELASKFAAWYMDIKMLDHLIHSLVAKRIIPSRMEVFCRKSSIHGYREVPVFPP
jgi:hypothetical protein